MDDGRQNYFPSTAYRPPSTNLQLFLTFLRIVSMRTEYSDMLFAPIDPDRSLERIAGGNETEVYTTDDHAYVVKVKCHAPSDGLAAVEQARVARKAATKFARIVGRKHSIPSYFIVARNRDGEVQPVVIQPFMYDARPLFSVDYATLHYKRRLLIARQLLHLIYRSATAFARGGVMPDLYGRASSSPAERKILNSWRMLPWRLWSFLVKRNLLRSHNLMLTNTKKPRVLLVDYDTVPHGKLYTLVYYYVRLALFFRDLALIAVMVLFGYVPKAE